MSAYKFQEFFRNIFRWAKAHYIISVVILVVLIGAVSLFIFGGNGVEKIIEVPLDELEKEQLDASIESVKTLVRACADLRL